MQKFGKTKMFYVTWIKTSWSQNKIFRVRHCVWIIYHTDIFALIIRVWKKTFWSDGKSRKGKETKLINRKKRTVRDYKKCIYRLLYMFKKKTVFLFYTIRDLNKVDREYWPRRSPKIDYLLAFGPSGKK